ncbi:MAG: hypothetical protein IAE91_07950 [Ignavibacteriaceae bacterium]|nr:hypothetical protein [Ignavibacteriaceae bacterium]
MAGKGLLIILIGSIVIAGSIFSNAFRQTNQVMDGAIVQYQSQVSQNIAQSGILMSLRELTNNPSWRSGYQGIKMQHGVLNVRVADTTFGGQTVIKVESLGYTNVGKKDQIVSNSIIYLRKTSLPSGIKGAITANNNVTTLGALEIDGRNWNMAGTSVTSGTGTLGIWTSGSLLQSGSSKIGGSNGGTDYTPMNPANSNAIGTAQAYPGGYPTSPDSILGGPTAGFPEGTLKAYAMSGAGGSQYVTDPDKLKTPLSGVTYLELPNGSDWQAGGGIDLTGTGILIVHNKWNNAVISNMNKGTFSGILIADDIDKIHNNVIGAVITLSPNPPSGNTIGNGNGVIKFSTEAIEFAMKPFGGAGISGSSSGAISAKNSVIWWSE